VRRSILPVLAVYTLSILIGLVLPAVAVALYCAIAVVLVVPFGALRRVFARRTWRPGHSGRFVRAPCSRMGSAGTFTRA
jgi:hypothetical protein